MKQRIERLSQLYQLKKQITQNKQVELIKVDEQLKQNQLKKDQLIGYKSEYLKQLEALGSQGSQIGRLRNRIDFINQLDSALSQLNAYLLQLTKQRAQVEWAYNQAKAAEEAVLKLIERVKMRQDLKKQKLEQKEFDEYAQKQWYSKKTDDNSIFPGE